MKKIFLGLITLAFIANANAMDITENFTANPLTNGWQIFGDTNLFQWDAAHHNLAVTWDSSQTNSYFYHPLGAALDTNSDFSLTFDLVLNDATNDGGTFQLAVGFINLTDATNSGFLRGTGYNATNLVEFDYFMDPLYGNSLAASQVDATGLFADVYDDVSFNTNTTYHITITHAAGDALVSAQVTVGNQLFSSLPNNYIETGFADFSVDTLAIASYDATGSYVETGTNGVSLLAHGTIDNIVFTTRLNPVGNITGGFAGTAWQTQFQSRTDWSYSLERSTNLQSWTPVSASNNGTGTILTLQDTNAPATRAFYRVHAQQ